MALTQQQKYRRLKKKRRELRETKTIIRQWVDTNIDPAHKCESVHINDDLTIDVLGSFVFNPSSIQEIPFKFGVMLGHFNTSKLVELNSLKNFPTYIEGNMLTYGQLTNLSNIHKTIKQCSNIHCIDPIESHILGVFFIKGLQGFKIETYGNLSKKKVNDIVAKYLPSKDIHGCQEELIENGLGQYARL